MKATESYNSSVGNDTVTMCLKKSVFKDIIEAFGAKEHFEQRAQKRRIEFRRIKKLYMREFNIEGESDEEDKVTNKEYYNESCLPDFLKDPTYYLTKHLDGITDEQLAEMSEDELVNKKSEKRRE